MARAIVVPSVSRIRTACGSCISINNSGASHAVFTKKKFNENHVVDASVSSFEITEICSAVAVYL